MNQTNNAKNFLTKDISPILCHTESLKHELILLKVNDYLLEQFKEITNCLTKTPYKILILTIVSETGDPVYWKNSFQNLVTDLKYAHPKLKIIVILDSWFELFQLDFTDVNEIFYINFFLFEMYEFLINQKTVVPISEWNPDAQNILFLTGKPDKIQRTRLLYKLLNSNIKHCLSWSYKIESKYYNESLVFLDDLQDNEKKAFLDSSYRELDNGGYWKFDPEIYKNSVFQIVSETEFDRPFCYPFITEKTWLPISNHMPFIIAGEFCHLNRLQSLGFRTFEKYLPVPNYDNPDLQNFLEYGQLSGNVGKFQHQQALTNWTNFYQTIRDSLWPKNVTKNNIWSLPKYVQEEIVSMYRPGYYSWSEIRLDAIVENAVFFKKNIKKYAKTIKQDVNYNFDKFVEIGLDNQLRLEQLCIRHNLTCKNLHEVFES
jgi:hypothetical protein